MHRNIQIAFFLLVLLGVASIGSLFYFSDSISVLSPSGLIALKQSKMLVLSTYLMLIVVVPVFLLLFFISWKYRETNKKAEYKPDWNHSTLAEALWWGVPCLIVLALGWITYQGAHELDPFKPLVSDRKPIRIQVVALRWKWLFLYPEEKIATVNLLRFPSSTPVNLEITADAPMNGFWIPDLAGQVYAMPGMKSKLHILADQAGKYRGSSSNLSGPGFSGMFFTAESSSQEEFDGWVESVRGSSEMLNWDAYEGLVKPSQYVAVSSYVLETDDLFDRIIGKYMQMEPKK